MNLDLERPLWNTEVVGWRSILWLEQERFVRRIGSVKLRGQWGIYFGLWLGGRRRVRCVNTGGGDCTRVWVTNVFALGKLSLEVSIDIHGDVL